MRGVRAVILGAIAVLGIAGCDLLPIAPGNPQVGCQGVPEAACRLAVDSLISADRPVRFVVRCTVPVCTDAEGEAEVTMRFADGRSEVSSYGWTTAPEAAGSPEPPPVPDGS